MKKSLDFVASIVLVSAVIEASIVQKVQLLQSHTKPQKTKMSRPILYYYYYDTPIYVACHINMSIYIMKLSHI